VFRVLTHPQQVLAGLPAADAPGVPGVALDGKTLRGSRKQGAPLTHLFRPSAIAWA
jgi:hypothetical protein